MGQPKLSSPDRWLEQDRAGAGVQSANRITLLRDADGDGVAEMRTVFLQGLNSPFGMALIAHDLYVANTDAIMRFTYMDGETQILGLGDKGADLPAGLINHHWTKNLIANRDGSRLYVTVGSTWLESPRSRRCRNAMCSQPPEPARHRSEKLHDST